MRKPKVISKASERAQAILENELRFDNCLANLVCPVCAEDLTKDQYMSSRDSAGFQGLVIAYKCKDCDFTWPQK